MSFDLLFDRLGRAWRTSFSSQHIAVYLGKQKVWHSSEWEEIVLFFELWTRHCALRLRLQPHQAAKLSLVGCIYQQCLLIILYQLLGQIRVHGSYAVQFERNLTPGFPSIVQRAPAKMCHCTLVIALVLACSKD